MLAHLTTRNLIRRPRRVILAVATLIAIVMVTSGLGAAADKLIDPLRIRLAGRPASGSVVVVELDAESLAAIRRWPWSRAHHARLVERLTRAGATSIVFDVDFSAAFDAAGDAAFARALRKSGGRVALPTFGQRARSGEMRQLDTLPLPIFRPHVAMASVSIAPDPDGLVRHAPWGTMTEGQPRPSLAAFIAGRSGTADTFYRIDFAIDPATIPRFSFVAVEQGRFDPAAIRGRNVLVGATAVELGDRYATPRWGVIPGVVIQALGAETLHRGVPGAIGDTLPLIIALLLAVTVVRARRLGVGIAVTIAALAAVLGGAHLLHGVQVHAPVAAALALIVTAAAGRLGLSVLRRFRRQQLTDAASGMGNRRALIAARLPGDAQMAVLRVTDYDSLSAVLGDAADRDLPRRIADRVRHAACDGAVWRIADRLLAFHLTAEAQADDVLGGLRAVMLQPIEVSGHRVDVASRSAWRRAGETARSPKPRSPPRRRRPTAYSGAAPRPTSTRWSGRCR